MLVRLALLACLAVSSAVEAAAEDISCPVGTTPAGETTPDVREAWCELKYNGAVVQHGPYRAWWPNGVLGTSGQYNYGMPVGKWLGWFPSGKLQGEEWYEHGNLVKSRHFNEQGAEINDPSPPNKPLQPTPDGAAERQR